MAIRVQTNPEDFGRCGCGRRDYCDGSHALSAEQWQALQAREAEQAAERPAEETPQSADQD